MNIPSDKCDNETNHFGNSVFHKFTQNCIDGLMIIDEKCRITYVNHAYCTLSGYSDGELPGKTISYIEARLDQEQFLKHLELVIEKGTSRFETSHKKKDGSVIDVEVTISDIRDEKNHFFIVVVRDVTEYRETIDSVNAVDAIKEIAVKASSRKEYFDSVVKMLRNWSNCNSVGIRLVNEEGIAPYEACIGFSNEFRSTENWLPLDDRCICTRVIREECITDESPYRTPKGSFYSNNLSNFSHCLTGCQSSNYRGTCIKIGFKSIAVIPIRYYKDVMGTIHLADEKEGKISQKLVKFLEKVAGYIGEVVYRYKMEEKLRRNYDILKTSDAINRLSLEGASLTEVLNHALELISDIPWVPLKSWGCIFLVDESERELVLKAQRKIKETNKLLCERVAFGQCLCGMAAQSKEVVFSTSSSIEHEIIYDQMEPHCQYSVPIVYSNKTVGVINVYLDEGYQPQRKDEEFLKRIADKLAHIIVRKKAERDLKTSEKHLSLIHNTVSDLICLIKVESKDMFTCAFVNKSFLDRLGLQQEQVMGKQVHELLPEPACSYALEKYKQAISQRKPLTYDEIVDLPNERIMTVTTLTPIFNKAGQCTHLLSAGHDITDRKSAEYKLKESLKYLRNTLQETVNALTIIAEKRDPYTVGHQQRVSQLAVAIANEMNCSKEMIEGIKISGLLHDIGKVGVPIEILNKPGRLSNLEMSIIKNHPEVGFEIVQKIPFDYPVAQTVLQHQERFDGTGYPLGLAGEDIILEARIMAVADVVEAMASHRPYRAGLGLEAALKEIRNNKGIFYDPQVVDACLRLFDRGYIWDVG